MNPKIVYLDQFAISNMASNISQWSNIKKQLKLLSDNKKIICTTSLESVMETSQRTEDVSECFKLINTLLNDTYLKDIQHIICMDINSLINNKIYEVNDYFAKEVKYDFNKNILSIRRNFGTDKNDINYAYNEIRANFYTEISNKYKSKIKDICQQKEIFNFLNYFIGNRNTNYFLYQIFDILITNMQFRKEDFESLYKEVSKNGFKNIPSLNIKNILDASCVFSKNFTNDIIDIRRIASSLRICDIAIYDNKWKYEIQENKLDMKYNTKLFSGKFGDIKLLEEYLLKL